MKNIQNNKKLNKVKLIFCQFFQIFLLFYQIKSEITECSRDLPILESNECKLIYCNKTQFDTNICQIKDSTIKTQWLNNIRVFGDDGFRYVRFASYSNGDMIIETTRYPGTTKRMFYGLKQNGRPFFKNRTNNNEETPFYSKDVYGQKDIDGQTEYIGNFESEAIVFKHIYQGKEYYLSVSKMQCYAELFDFDNDNVYDKPSYSFAKDLFIHSIKNSLFALSKKDYETNYYYFFGFIATTFYGGYNAKKVYFQKHLFITNDFPRDQTLDSQTDQPNGYGNGISCFQTNLRFIICFYSTKVDNTIYYNLIKYDRNFENKNNPPITNFESNVDDIDNFLKCVHLEGEAGIFAYYKSFSTILYPIFLFKQFDQSSNSFQNYLPSSYSESSIALQNYQFNNNLLLNDLIKINEKKIVFASTLIDKETLYITLFNIFGDRNIRIRYYSIKIYDLYHYKLLKELRIHNYNNFIAFASSYCPNRQCDLDTDEHYSSLILFSYPNTKDENFYLDKYLFDHNNITINNIEIYLKEQFNIDNNLFGYILSSISIKEINDCGDYKLYSSKNEKKK